MKKTIRIIWILFFIFLIGASVMIGGTAAGFFGKLPSLEDLENPESFLPADVFASDGTLMGKFYQESGNRSYVAYNDISKYLVYALLATEDKRFYEHSGIDAKGLGRALKSLGKQGGGSTVTQQLAKNLLEQGRGSNIFVRFQEKIKEWVVASRLEKNFTKEEIITLFLNQLEYSENIFGIRNAARTFFQKEPDRVTIEEAAVLVGMINNPTVFNPRKNPKAAIDRRNLVLDRMAENTEIASLIGTKPISLSDAARFKSEPIALRFKKEVRATGMAPYFRDVLRVSVMEKLKTLKKSNGKNYNIYQDGLKIYTTINPKMQIYAEEAVAEHLSNYQRDFSGNHSFFESQWRKHPNVLEREMKNSERYKTMHEQGFKDEEIRKVFNTKVKMKVFTWNALREKDTTISPMDSIKHHRQMLQSAFMVMEPTTGEVKAWVGGINYKKFQLDHVTALRQVGSAIKPMLYGLNVEEGLEAESTVQNAAQFYSGFTWYPNGYGNHGDCTLATGLAYSYNGVASYLLKRVGIKKFKDFLENQCGITEKLNAYPSICLGADEIPLIQLLRAYTMFPGSGTNTEPYYVTKIEDRNGNLVKSYMPERKDVMSETTAYKMTKIMEGPVTKGTAKGLKYGLGIKAMGGKTGTTNDNSDLWFVGYTPQLLAGVWVGCDDRFIRSQNGNAYQGGKAAAPIWRNFFRKVLNDKTLGIKKDTSFTKPASMLAEATSDYTMLINAVDEDYKRENNGAAPPAVDNSDEIKTPTKHKSKNNNSNEYNTDEENAGHIPAESSTYTDGDNGSDTGGHKQNAPENVPETPKPEQQLPPLPPKPDIIKPVIKQKPNVGGGK